MVQIIPAILATSEEDYQRDVARYKQSISFKEGWVHIDFMDNMFVPNKSIGASETAKYPIDLHKEAHLMVQNPFLWIDELVKAGFERVLLHIEAENIEDSIEKAKEKGLEKGLAVKNDTELTKIEPFLERVDTVLIMGVELGFQGQEFIPESLNKIKEISKLREDGGYGFKIEVDGAIKDDNIKAVVQAGADFVIVGSYLLKGDIDENLENLWEKIK